MVHVAAATGMPTGTMACAVLTPGVAVPTGDSVAGVLCGGLRGHRTVRFPRALQVGGGLVGIGSVPAMGVRLRALHDSYWHSNPRRGSARFCTV
ncbi:MAG: hypothetical protein ACK5LN_04940 [Propioniciclava sp.]